MPTKKTNKKPAVKKTVAKKPVVKKIVVKSVAKPVVAQITTEQKSACEFGCCGCGCGCGQKIKKLIKFVIIFALGWVACCYVHHDMKHFGFHQNMFVNGCLDTTKIKNPEVAQNAIAADSNADGCIAKDEWKEWKK